MLRMVRSGIMKTFTTSDLLKMKFPAIAFNNTLTSEATLSCEPTLSSLNNEIEFRISFDESDDEDYTVIFDKNSFSYKMISVDKLKTDLKNDNEKVNMPLLPSPEPTVSYFDDLDFFKDFEKEFPAIVYHDAQTSKLNFLTKPTLSPQHIDEFNLKDETALSKYDEEEQNIIYFNDLFPINVIDRDEFLNGRSWLPCYGDLRTVIMHDKDAAAACDSTESYDRSKHKPMERKLGIKRSCLSFALRKVSFGKTGEVKPQFVEEPVEIMDRDVKRLKRSCISLAKVQWNSKRGPEFTWEREDQFKKKYPHLFNKTAPSSSAASRSVSIRCQGYIGDFVLGCHAKDMVALWKFNFNKKRMFGSSKTGHVKIRGGKTKGGRLIPSQSNKRQGTSTLGKRQTRASTSVMGRSQIRARTTTNEASRTQMGGSQTRSRPSLGVRQTRSTTSLRGGSHLRATTTP
ncbi:hypothetical protein Tco_1409934 [Tanacetum coccineum]